MAMIVDTPTLATPRQRVRIETTRAERTEADVAHWPEFGKSARLAARSPVGVRPDIAPGYLRRVSQRTVLTARRKAANPAFAARRLANRDARTLALIGNGAQGLRQARAVNASARIRRIRDDEVRALGLGADVARVPAPRDPKGPCGSVVGLAAR